MTKILVVNHAHSEVCGIHDLGRRLVHRLSASSVLDVEYLEANDRPTYRAARETFWPDIVIINYRHDLMPWVPEALNHTGALRIGIMHNYDEGTIDRRGEELLARGFDFALAFDPIARALNPRVITTGRVLPMTVDPPQLGDFPRIGSFGFAFPHKRFDLVADAIAAAGITRGTYSLHMPEAYFNGASGGSLYAPEIVERCRQLLPRGVELEYTSDHVNERDVVARLAANDVNCLLYEPGQTDGGRSSALDYLIAARRPILVSKAAMFSHARDVVAVWPDVSIREMSESLHTWCEAVDRYYWENANRVVEDIERLCESL